MSPRAYSRVLSPVVAAISLTICLHGQLRAANKQGGISGEVKIDFAAQKLSAKLKYDYLASKTKESAIHFYLNEAFYVQNVTCRLCLSFNFDRQAKPNPSLIISLKRPLARGERIPLQIEYDGSLKGIYRSDYKFLELGLDYFWYPIHSAIPDFNFTYDLMVHTDEPDFQLISNGHASRNGRDWRVKSRVPDLDIDIVLGADLKLSRYQQGKYDLQIVSRNMPADACATLLGHMREALDFYNSTFGASDPQREVTGVFRPFLEPQFGYFRKGYFILPATQDMDSILFPVSHELSHYWWLKAGQQNAWLNESFAEYSAMLFLRRTQGFEAFQKMIEDKRKRSVDLPAVYGFDRTKNRQAAVGVLYRKGVIKLRELEAALGEDRFLSFLREVAQEKVSDTDTLIELLAKFSSRDVANDFLENLKK
jgi:hypothetical protein